MLKNYENKINEIKDSIRDIANGLVKANEIIVIALKNYENDKFDEAKTFIKNSSKKTNAIDDKIIGILALHSPEAKDLRLLVSYLKITNELLRASSNTRNFIKGFSDITTQIDDENIKNYAIHMQKSTLKALKHTTSMINISCSDEIQEVFNKVLIAQSKAEDFYELIENSMFKQIKNMSKTSNQKKEQTYAIENFDKFYHILSALRKSIKISDRSIAIASLLLFANLGGKINQA
jgi:phosphate transport system protein